MKVQPFEREELGSGYVQYVHRPSGRISHVDPHLDAAVERIAAETNCIRYTTYRLAAKLELLSRELFLNTIPYALVTSVLERHYLQHTDNAPLVRPDRLTALLHDIFFAAQSANLFIGRPEFQLEQCVGMVANLMWNIFDKNRTTPLSLLELKQTFLLLCRSSSYDRQIFEHFLLAADHNACVSRYRFESMVAIMAKIFIHIDPLPAQGRPTSFFTSAPSPIIDDCFAQCPGPVGLNKFQFYTLWRRAPSGLASFGHFANVQALIGRLTEAKSLVHERRTCVGCNASPIRGLCFRCVQCRKVELCFGCFGRGFAAGRHGVDHRMYEISPDYDKPKSKRLRSFLGKLCQLFSGTANPHDEDSRTHNITMETNVIQIDADAPRHCSLSSQETTATASENERNCLAEQPRVVELTLNARSLPQNVPSTDQETASDSDPIDTLMQQINRLTEFINSQKSSGEQTFLCEHRSVLERLAEQFKASSQQQLSNRQSSQTSIRPHFSSTPYCQRNKTTNKLTEFNALMANSLLSSSTSDAAVSIKGADINRSYLEANKSDLSMGDLSNWLHTRRPTDSMRNQRLSMPTVSENVDTEMSAFRELLNVVKEILEDSYSDNAELSKVTNQLEKVLDHIIDDVATKHDIGQAATTIDTYV